MKDLSERLRGVLLGTAVGDALGLPMEGMSAPAIARSFPRLNRFQLLGRRGFVSDDTEQSALVAESLLRAQGSRPAFERAFRRALLGWFLRLPWGIGWGTLRACARIALGLQQSGVSSAGNGAAMRAAVVGVALREDATSRRAWSDALARITHTDPRAVEGARFVAELAALASLAAPSVHRPALYERAAQVVENAELRAAVDRAAELATRSARTDEAARSLGNSGYVVHSVALALFAFLRFGDDSERALTELIAAGGDTDSNAAILGAWCGALHGEQGLPSALVGNLSDGPFGPSHLRALAMDLAGQRLQLKAYFSPLRALVQNLLLYPVVLAHAFRVAASSLTAR